jgi:hypothetical protein
MGHVLIAFISLAQTPHARFGGKDVGLVEKQIE